jgi:hypothetical protein
LPKPVPVVSDGTKEAVTALDAKVQQIQTALSDLTDKAKVAPHRLVKILREVVWPWQENPPNPAEEHRPE